MAASSCCRSAAWCLGVWLGLSGSARAEATYQSELTCLLDSGDVLGDAERAETLPWEELASVRRGDASRTRLALATTDPGFLPGVRTDASLRLELGLNEVDAGAASLRDVSSSLGLTWRLGRVGQLSLRAFPFDTDYVRLGYLHTLDWGGTDAGRGESVFLAKTGAAPGLRLGFELGRMRLFSGLKWATADDPLRGRRRLWGLLFGGSAALGASLQVEGGFGYFQRPAFSPSKAAPGFVEGASLRVVWHRGVVEPAPSAEPFRPPTFAEDPTRFESTRAPGFALALEAVTLVQRLRRFEAPSTTELRQAPAAALYGSARGRRLAAHAALTWRSLPFVLRNDARLARGETLPQRALEHAELTAWLGASVALPGHLVPSAEVALRLPAALQTPSALPGLPQTLVVGGPSGLEALPTGAGRLPVVSGRLGARFQASTSVTLALFGEYQRNPNRVAFGTLGSSESRVFAAPDSLALLLAAQARF